MENTSDGRIMHVKSDKGEILKGALLLITISLWVLALIVCCCMIVNIARRRSHEE